MSPGMSQKHFEKLIQCDARLNFLSRQPEVALDPPYFESSRFSVFEEIEAKPRVFDPVKAAEPALGPGFPDETLPTIPSAVQPTFFKMEHLDHGGRTLEQHPQESFFPNSVMTVSPIDGSSDQFQGTKKRSMSKLDLMNYLDDMMSPSC